MYEDTESWAKGRSLDGEWMAVELSLEQQLIIEAGTRELKKQQLDQEFVEVAVALLHQNVIQGQIIKQCTKRISELEAKIICQENKVKQPHLKDRIFKFFLRKEVP